VARIEDARLGDVPSTALTIAHAESSAEKHQDSGARYHLCSKYSNSGMIEASPFAVAEGEPDEGEHVTRLTNYSESRQEKAANLRHPRCILRRSDASKCTNTCGCNQRVSKKLSS
jgi:hypothetical protein